MVFFILLQIALIIIEGGCQQVLPAALKILTKSFRGLKITHVGVIKMWYFNCRRLYGNVYEKQGRAHLKP
jgi:hypothetical protein